MAAPPARLAAGLAYDPSTGRLVMFGGLSEADVAQKRYPYGDTWEFTGRRWVLRTPPVAPPARGGAVMDTDTNRERVLLFGGATVFNETGIEYADTWSYQNGTWTQLQPPASPPSRRQAAGAFDRTRDRLIVYGGLTGKDTILRDTWEFDGTTWTQVASNGPSISGVRMVVDQDSGETLLTGIEVLSGSTFEARMYRWTNGEWVRLEPETLPRCISSTGLTWQEHSGEVVLHGGSCPNGGQNADTFTWNGTNWVKRTTTGSAGFVVSQAMAYSPTLQETILFGGQDLFTRSSTYRFRNDRWSLYATSGYDPGARSLMVFETATFNGHTAQYLFGGLEDGFSRTDLWRLDEGTWTRISADNAPTNCSYPAGAFDPDRSRLVIVCENSSVYEYDGTRWHTFTGLTTQPDSRRWSSLAYDPVRKQMVLFGGYVFPSYENDTWLWNGSRWTRAERRNLPDGRALATMFWDPASSRILMYGGIGRRSNDDRIKRYGDMWTFDGTRWTQITPSTLPSERYGAATVWDPERERIVMFGGKNADEQYINEHWEWNGSNWNRVEIPSAPESRMNHGMTWDPVRGAIVLYGGYAGKYFPQVLMLQGEQWSTIPQPWGRARGVGRP